jgi:hypothetical protein
MGVVEVRGQEVVLVLIHLLQTKCLEAEGVLAVAVVGVMRPDMRTEVMEALVVVVARVEALLIVLGGMVVLAVALALL